MAHGRSFDDHAALLVCRHAVVDHAHDLDAPDMDWQAERPLLDYVTFSLSLQHEIGYNVGMARTGYPTRAVAGISADVVTDAVLAASRLLVGLSARSIASVDDSITMPQFRLLVVLSTRGPLKLTMLAEYLDVRPPTATRMIDRLVGAGLVDRRTSPVSRREVVLDLTDAGASTVGRVTQRRRREIARIISLMPERQRSALVEAFEAFRDAGGEPAVEPALYTDWI